VPGQEIKKAAGGSGRRPGGCPPRRAIIGSKLSAYWNPSLRICELALSVLAPRNHGGFNQLTVAYGTDVFRGRPEQSVAVSRSSGQTIKDEASGRVAAAQS
jgi:hypothetical protein